MSFQHHEKLSCFTLFNLSLTHKSSYKYMNLMPLHGHLSYFLNIFFNLCLSKSLLSGKPSSYPLMLENESTCRHEELIETLQHLLTHSHKITLSFGHQQYVTAICFAKIYTILGCQWLYELCLDSTSVVANKQEKN